MNIKQQIITWAKNDDNIRAAVLSGSRVTNKAKVDDFSDYDVEIYVNDVTPFKTDDWLSYFGEIMVRWPVKPQSTYNEEGITRLVHFKEKHRIDFQITPKSQLGQFEGPYEVLIDKDNQIPPSENSDELHWIKKPSFEEFNTLIQEFFWEATYVAKNLSRDELYFAKFNLDNVIRFEYLRKALEWYIGMQHDWSTNTGKQGQYFKQYLDAETWNEVESTFSGASISDNWKAFSNTMSLFRKLTKAVGKKLDYEYPEEIDTEVSQYCNKISLI